jgi:hypothetical protein
MTPAARKRLYRARRRAGIIVVPVPIDAVSVPAALVQAGLLAPQDEDNATAIGAALAQICLRFAE